MGKNSKYRPKVGNSDIGTDGNPGSPPVSSEGVVWPHMPADTSYPNASLGDVAGKKGPTATTTKHNYPELPEGYNTGLRKGNK